MTWFFTTKLGRRSREQYSPSPWNYCLCGVDRYVMYYLCAIKQSNNLSSAVNTNDCGNNLLHQQSAHLPSTISTHINNPFKCEVIAKRSTKCSNKVVGVVDVVTFFLGSSDIKANKVFDFIVNNRLIVKIHLPTSAHCQIQHENEVIFDNDRGANFTVIKLITV